MDQHLCVNKPRDVAQLLLTTAGLNKHHIGTYLGKASKYPFQMEVVLSACMCGIISSKFAVGTPTTHGKISVFLRDFSRYWKQFLCVGAFKLSQSVIPTAGLIFTELPLREQVLYNFFRHTDLHRVGLDDGLRKWLQGYYMPVDWSQQDFLLEMFCKRFEYLTRRRVESEGKWGRANGEWWCSVKGGKWNAEGDVVGAHRVWRWPLSMYDVA